MPWLKLHTHLPVIVDPSHASGDRRLVEPLARAAAAVGADGIIVEVHDDPRPPSATARSCSRTTSRVRAPRRRAPARRQGDRLMELDAAVAAIRAGDVAAFEQGLAAAPSLATARVGPRTLLHAQQRTGQGGLPDVAGSIRALVAAGADVDAHFSGPAHDETPLHWAASADDVAALDALLDEGADIDAHGGIIGGSTPLADATAFGQWRAARRLVERGATDLDADAAALGLIGELDDVPADELDGALWAAAHGGQRDVAELLLARGADPGWVGWDELTALGAAERSGAVDVAALLRR